MLTTIDGRERRRRRRVAARGPSPTAGWQRGAMVARADRAARRGRRQAGRSSRRGDARHRRPPPSRSRRRWCAQVSEWDDYVGRFAPSRTVEIRPRVVGRGRPASTSATARSSARASCSSRSIRARSPPRWPRRAPTSRAPRSALALARTDLGRAQPAGRRRGGLRRRGRCAARPASRRRRPRSPRRRRASAPRALDVEFTQVRAPIAGRISDRRVDVGNLVAGGEGTGGTVLTTINALDPIYFTFDGSEALYLKAQRARQPGATPARGRDPACRTRPSYRWKGKLDFTDNGLDPRSGTIRGRAVLANPGLFPDAGHVRQHAARQRRRRSRRCWCPTPRSRPIRRARSCWSSSEERHGRGQAGRARPGGRRPARRSRSGSRRPTGSSSAARRWRCRAPRSRRRPAGSRRVGDGAAPRSQPIAGEATLADSAPPRPAQRTSVSTPRCALASRPSPGWRSVPLASTRT